MATPEIKDIRVSTFLNQDVKEFAQYVLQSRALPNIMDGLRIGQRKIIYSAMVGDLNKKQSVKLYALIGDALKCQYHHGDVSLANSIVTLSLKHNNKYCPLEVIGQIPSLRVPQVDVATRYLSVKRSKYFDLFTADKELLTIQEEEGEKIEPKFFLPIVPMVLLNRTNSPGFGFAFRSKSYNLDTIIDNLITAINDGSCQKNPNKFVPLKPEIEGIRPELIVFNAERDKWYNAGEYKINHETGVMTVTDLPYDVSFDAFEGNLNDLKELGEIKSFENQSYNDQIKYVITFDRQKLGVLSKNILSFGKRMKLISMLPDDILNVIDEDQKTIIFCQDAYEFIDLFVEKRLKYYHERKERTIKYLQGKIEELSYRIRFIEHVINKEIVVVEQPKDSIRQQLDKHEIPYFVMDMKLWTLTEEEILELRKKIKDYEEQLDYIKNTTEKEMYIFDLINIKQQLGLVRGVYNV